MVFVAEIEIYKLTLLRENTVFALVFNVYLAVIIYVQVDLGPFT
jgi:hypothetical protein